MHQLTKENEVSFMLCSTLHYKGIFNMWRWLNFKYNNYSRDSIAKRSSKNKSRFLQIVHDKTGCEERAQLLEITASGKNSSLFQVLP